MQFIVLDLEWNQPLSYESSAYKSVGSKLIFEMIQIGAVKLNERLEIVDSFNQLIQPTHYFKLHPQIKRITQISQEDLEDAPHFPEAFGRFIEWCGEDYALLTWGCDDISVFAQNISFFACKNELGKVYDLQQMFGDIIDNHKERQSLKAAMDYYQIEPSEEKAFHNAVNDAYYTALVFSHFDETEEIVHYPLKARKLLHTDKRKKMLISILRAGKSLPDLLKGQAAQNPPCPICGKKHELAAEYVLQRNETYTALSICPDHGLMLVKLRLIKNEEGKKMLERCVLLSDEQSDAYVHTKLLQWQMKLEQQEKEN